MTSVQIYVEPRACSEGASVDPTAALSQRIMSVIMARPPEYGRRTLIQDVMSTINLRGESEPLAQITRAMRPSLMLAPRTA
jgi:hypothetical protein